MPAARASSARAREAGRHGAAEDLSWGPSLAPHPLARQRRPEADDGGTIEHEKCERDARRAFEERPTRRSIFTNSGLPLDGWKRRPATARQTRESPGALP